MSNNYFFINYDNLFFIKFNEIFQIHDGFDLMTLSGSRPSLFGLKLGSRLLTDSTLMNYRISPEKRRKSGRPEYPEELRVEIDLIKCKFLSLSYFNKAIILVTHVRT